MKTNRRFLLTAILVLASAFIFSCSSPGGSTNWGNSPSSGSSGGNEVSYEYCITAIGCLPGPFTASTCTGQLSNSCPTNPPPSPSSSSGGGNSTIGVPAAPTGLRVTLSSTNLQASWNAVAGASGYRLYFAYNSQSEWYLLPNILGTSYTESDNFPAGTYYFVVTAYNASGESDESNMVSATITGTPTPNLSLDGVWGGENGWTTTFSGSNGVLSSFGSPPPGGALQDAINKGYYTLGMQEYRNLTSAGTLKWSGQAWRSYSDNQTPNVSKGANWTNCTITMSADGQTITVELGATSSNGQTINGVSWTMTRQR
ncbi:MAG: fibronectin type III domain-containing protein [Fibromonadales bacterium]|nr:fibronectin type III domain-containing protein [Fibromonadales bacterium]